MATTTDANILEGLLVRLSTLVLSTPLPVAYPNVNFNPPAGGYLRVTHLPNVTTQVTLGDNGENRHVGIFQVSVFFPVDRGSIAPGDLAGEIIAHFKRGTVINHGGLITRIIRPPTPNPSLLEEPYRQYPVTIEYQTDAANPS